MWDINWVFLTPRNIRLSEGYRLIDLSPLLGNMLSWTFTGVCYLRWAIPRFSFEKPCYCAYGLLETGLEQMYHCVVYTVVMMHTLSSLLVIFELFKKFIARAISALRSPILTLRWMWWRYNAMSRFLSHLMLHSVTFYYFCSRSWYARNDLTTPFTRARV